MSAPLMLNIFHVAISDSPGLQILFPLQTPFGNGMLRSFISTQSVGDE